MPKTIRNVYDQAVSFENLLVAHKKARRGKREKKEVILFELNLESEILEIEKDLREGKYKPGEYKTFKIFSFFSLIHWYICIAFIDNYTI